MHTPVISATAVAVLAVLAGAAPSRSTVVAAPLAVSSSGAADTSVAARVDSLVRARVAADSFSGVVILARDGASLYRVATGVADRDTRAPNGFDTRFNLGSVDKYFTRIAVRQLQRFAPCAPVDSGPVASRTRA
jgi:CubicO group peptidase (beta-lactamase class C family)